VLVGAIDYSAAVVALASQAGYHIVIVDAARPGRAARVIVFSHDPKFDEPALMAALRSDAGYIGALGTRRTAADRNARLLARGCRPKYTRARALAVRARHRGRNPGGRPRSRSWPR
jgi:xanthine dehydrogenase accessory factor